MRWMRPVIVVPLFLVANFILLLSLADRDGYEGDDLNSIVPMFHLAAAKQGLLLIYRYAWQPLAYEVGGAIWRWTATPDLIFLSAPLAGAIAIGLLLLCTWQRKASPADLALSLIVLLMIPEFWWSGLYYNSSVLGLPFAAGALWLLMHRSGLPSAIGAGIAIGAAILMRLDFALACPVYALIASHGLTNWRRPLLLAASVSGILLLAWGIGLLDPVAILHIQQTSAAEIADKRNFPGWDRYTKTLVLTVILSPVGWLVLLSGGPIALWHLLRRRPLLLGIGLLACLPFVLLVKDLLSPKYALPMLVFAPLVLRCSIIALAEYLPRWAGARVPAMAGIASVLLLFVSLSPGAHPPSLGLGLAAAKPVGTHDGPRSYGGYLWEAMRVRDAPLTPQQQLSQQVESIWQRQPDGALRVVADENYFEPGGAAWRDLQLSLESAGVHGRLTGPHRLEFDQGGRHLTLLTQLEPGRGALLDLRSMP